MRFKRLKMVTAILILIVLSACVCTALVRKFVIPAPQDKNHASLDLSQTQRPIWES
jgi:hypothetical protein